MAIRIQLPIPYHKAVRLILPCGLMLAGLTIFLCGLVRTYHIDEVLTKNVHEEKMLQSQNEFMEWWVGFPLIACSILAVSAVLYDKPLLFKLSVLAIGTCFVLLVYGLLWDAGDFSWIARNFEYVKTLESEGFNCTTRENRFNYSGHSYNFRNCHCTRNNEFSIGLYVPYSCELLRSQYYLHAVLAFALSCGIGLSLFTSFSFVLILKRISQITTALHLDEKPLSEDFDNIQGDLSAEVNAAVLKPYVPSVQQTQPQKAVPAKPVLVGDVQQTKQTQPQRVPARPAFKETSGEYWIKELSLKNEEKTILKCPIMLNDRHINAAQKLLKKKFPHVSGLQDTILSQTSFVTTQEEGIQIHNTGAHHWITSSSIGGYVKVCDSVYDDLALSTKAQLAQCYHTLIDELGRLEVDIPPVQTQTGSVDCGLFAIAFAYELAVGKQPVDGVRFDQNIMRSHLLSCFENRELTHFPQARR